MTTIAIPSIPQMIQMCVLWYEHDPALVSCEAITTWAYENAAAASRRNHGSALTNIALLGTRLVRLRYRCLLLCLRSPFILLDPLQLPGFRRSGLWQLSYLTANRPIDSQHSQQQT